jgi:hypothetical protein
MNTPARLILAGVGSALLLAATGLAIKWGVGHAMLEAKLMSPEVVTAGLGEIVRARKLNERADAHDLFGHYSLTAATRQHGDVARLHDAASAFRRSAAERPSMPYAWAHLALAKYRLGETDAEFLNALTLAMRLGPWEPELQAIVADLGLAMLDEVPPELRNSILANIRRGVVQQGDLMVNLAIKRGRLTEVCNLGLTEKLAVRCRPSSNV